MVVGIIWRRNLWADKLEVQPVHACTAAFSLFLLINRK